MTSKAMSCRHTFVATGPYVSCSKCGGGRECRGWKAACKRLLPPERKTKAVKR